MIGKVEQLQLGATFEELQLWLVWGHPVHGQRFDPIAAVLERNQLGAGILQLKALWQLVVAAEDTRLAAVVEESVVVGSALALTWFEAPQTSGEEERHQPLYLTEVKK